MCVLSIHLSSNKDIARYLDSFSTKRVCEIKEGLRFKGLYYINDKERQIHEFLA